MLVLTRKFGERLFLTTPAGERVEILVERKKGSEAVRIGIEAPQAIRIHREEIPAE